MSAKKRPSLAEFQREATKPKGQAKEEKDLSQEVPMKSLHKSVYIPPAILEQMDLLALQERPKPGRRKTFNALVLEGLDLLFKSRGLPGVEELLQK